MRHFRKRYVYIFSESWLGEEDSGCGKRERRKGLLPFLLLRNSATLTFSACSFLISSSRLIVLPIVTDFPADDKHDQLGFANSVDPITYHESDPITYQESDPITYQESDPITYQESDPITYAEADQVSDGGC